MVDKGNGKGAVGEEALRHRFQQMGYFVVRSIPYAFRESALTDVDLWLYGRTGAFRERINVDVKRKKTPQAIERIFWTLGVMQVLRLDRCIVVTTETNPAVVEFGKRSGVTVIDGRFLQGAVSSPPVARLSEEQFVSTLSSPGAEQKAKDLRRRYDGAKKRLLTHLNFDGCNLHLVDIKSCMDDLGAYPGIGGSTRRVLYMLISHLAITLDYLMSRSVFAAPERRQHEIEEGLRYGNAGSLRVEEFSRLLNGCKAGDSGEAGRVIDGIIAKLRAEMNSLRTDMIAEYVMHQIGPEKLFLVALAFEDAAFQENCPSVADLPTALKSALLMLVDFFALDRKAAVTW